MAGSDEAPFVVRANGLWGDYGNLLAHGMTAHRSRVEGRLQLERTAPFIPPMTLPGISDCVFTEALRQAYLQSGLTGIIRFEPVDKTHIVRLNWHEWDRTDDEPEEFPPGGEPENYILKARHDAKAAAALGLVWECTFQEFGRNVTETTRTPAMLRRPMKWVQGTGAMPDFFRAPRNREPDAAPIQRARIHGRLLVSRKARMWLQDQTATFLEFAPVTACSA